jgi:hypothetical protein
VSSASAGVDQEVMGAVQAALSGQGDVARQRLDVLWSALSPVDFFHRCVVAHYMADLQADPMMELHWDRLALAAALAAAPPSFDDRIPGVTWKGFLPSLHLNLAASYERVADLDAARRHAGAARLGLEDVGDTPLGNLTRSAIDRLCERLGGAE